MSLIVFSSINLDLVTKTPRLPLSGKTDLVGPVGNDTFGQELCRHRYGRSGGLGAAARALATTKIGVQSALCDRATLEKFLAAHPVNIL